MWAFAVNGLVAVIAFTWLGMVAGVSFLEAPLKFRAPGVTVRLGLGIGRLVFAALNRVEVALLAVIAVALLFGAPNSRATVWPAAVAAVVLAVQLTLVRPPLNRRSDRVLAGEDPPRSRAHLGYVALEVAKVAVLVWLGVSALAAHAAPIAG